MTNGFFTDFIFRSEIIFWKKKAESNKEDRLRRLLQNMERANEILSKSGEPLLVGFIFQELAMMTASMVSIADINLQQKEKQSKSRKRKGGVI